MTNILRALGFTFLLASNLALAQGTYTQIDYPGAISTQATAIDTAGDIVGIYIDGLGGHGFLLKGGVYTTIDYPGAQYSYIYGINDQGQLVGVAEPNGFLYDMATQAFTTVNYPGALFTFPQAINNAGTIAGLFQHQKGRGIVNSGFELTGSTYRAVGLHGAISTMIYGISSAGDLVGFTDLGGTLINFFDIDGQFRRIPLSAAPGALVYGINPQATACVGSYDSLTGVGGFIFQNTSLDTLSFSGSITTEASGINSGGEVVGYFIDQSEAVHGFTWTPPAAAEKK